MRAATYVRLSTSRLGEEAPGLERQREACKRLVRERGWELAESFHDADTSAFRAGVPRPGFADLRHAVEASEVEAVVVWKLDRAFRRLREGVEFLDLCRGQGIAFVSVTEGIDTTSPFGPVLFALFSAMAELESKTKSDRIVAWHLQRAERGLPVGGGTRAFGFKEDRVTHEPTEARLIKSAARDLLSGGTLTGIARTWNERGIPTPTGKRWSKTTVRRLLLSPRIAGMREHNGSATYGASWKPMIAEGDHLRLRALFDGNGAPTGRRYLLTGGLAVCGLCGAKLVARPKADRRRCYVCATDQGGCGKIRQLAAPLEEHVADEVNRAFENRQISAPPAPPPDEEPLRRQLAADERALEELARDRYVRRSISDPEFRAAREPLVARIAEIQGALARLARGSRRTFLAHLDELPTAPWELQPGVDPDPDELQSWRDHVAEYVEKVVVKPAVRGRNFFDLGRIEIVWR